MIVPPASIPPHAVRVEVLGKGPKGLTCVWISKRHLRKLKGFKLRWKDEKYVGVENGRFGKDLHTLLYKWSKRVVPKDHQVHHKGEAWEMWDEMLIAVPRPVNSQAKAKGEGTTSKYIGVSWKAEKEKWQAQTKYQGRPVHLLFTADEKEAARAYDRAALAIHGEHAKTNVLTPPEIAEVLADRERFLPKLPKKMPSRVLARVMELRNDPNVSVRITRDEEGHAIITLSQGKVSRVRDEDWPVLAAYAWSYDDKLEYAIGYIVTEDGRAWNERMHRFIVEVIMGLYIPGGWVVDHIDGDRLNNCRENLRVVTHATNNRNKGFRPGETGTSENGKNGWAARICVNGKTEHLGTFPTRKQAHEAYMRRHNELIEEEQQELARLRAEHAAKMERMEEDSTSDLDDIDASMSGSEEVSSVLESDPESDNEDGEDDEDDEDDVAPPPRRRCIRGGVAQLDDTMTVVINVFDSQKNAAKSVGAAPATMNGAIHRGGKCRGYFWNHWVKLSAEMKEDWEERKRNGEV